MFGVFTLSDNALGFGCGGSSSYTTAGGATSSTGTPQSGLTCSVPVNGTTPTGAGGIAATSQSQATIDITSGFCCNGDTESDTSYTHADLATGGLEVSAGETNNYNGTGGHADANAGFFDTLYFSNIPVNATSLGVVFEYNGTNTNPANLGTA